MAAALILPASAWRLVTGKWGGRKLTVESSKDESELTLRPGWSGRVTGGRDIPWTGTPSGKSYSGGI